MNNLFWIIAASMGAVALIVVTRPLTSGSTSMPRIAVAVAMLVPALALSLYTLLGSPQAAKSQLSAMRAGSSISAGSPSSSAPKKVDSVGSMLEGLERRLESEPDDAGSWLLLAKSYHHLDRPADAKVAYAKAVALGKSDPALEQLLKDAPGVPANDEESPSEASIRGSVSIAKEIAGEVDPTATIFVFAKAVNGSPMPLAVVRKSASELPFEFVLDDSLAMVAGMTMSSAKQVEISAKVSSTGNAMQPNTGMEANSGAITVGETGYVELQITQKK